jgi:hypothetical protein
MSDLLNVDSGYLWKPLLEATAQTIVGAIGAFTIKKISERIYRKNMFDGPMDFWKRGMHQKGIEYGDKVHIDCLLSPYTQLFPGDPFENANFWRRLYQFEGKITSSEFQAMEFFVTADEALRVGSINGETLVSLYHRYGYIGDGIPAIVPTAYIKKIIPEFFEKSYFGTRVIVNGILRKCPSQHGLVAQGIAKNAGINIEPQIYFNLPCIDISSIKLFNKSSDTSCSLLGSPWAVTDNKDEQYLMQYGYLDRPDELNICLNNIKQAKTWKNVRVFFDDLAAPSKEMSFKRNFL